MGRVREKRRVEERRVEKRRVEERKRKRKSQKKEETGVRKVAKCCVFPMMCGSGGGSLKQRVRSHLPDEK